MLVSMALNAVWNYSNNYGKIQTHNRFKRMLFIRTKGLAHADLAKKLFFCMNFYYVRLLCSINFCFGPVEMRQVKNNCSGLNIDWDPPPPPPCSYLRNAYYVITFCCFTQVFVDSAYKQLTVALSQARNLLRRNN